MITKLAAMLAGLVACGPTAEYVPYSNMPTPSAISPQDVAVYWAPPPCPYRELGFIETTHIWPVSHAQEIWELRRLAGRNGAGAIIIAEHEHEHGGGGNFTAVAIAHGCAVP